MKNLKSILIVASIISVVLLMWVLIKPSQANHEANEHQHVEGDAHDHGAESHEGHDDHSEKMVYLNLLQLKNAEIDTGWFSMKNMSDVIQVNGHTKLPPQNQADVSVFTNGMIKRIQVVEGQEVRKGQVLAIIESPEFTILQEKYQRSKSRLTYLNSEFERQSILQEEDINAKKVLEKTASERDMEEASYNSLKKQLQMLKVNGESSTISTVPILAPISGHITDVMIKIGSSVSPNMPLFSIVDNSEMHVDLMVYEKDLGKVKVDQKVRFRLTNQGEEEILGTVFNIGKSFENETKTVAVHADIDSESENLIPGMYVNAFIDIGENLVQTLPDDAIVQAEGRFFIFIMEKENFLKPKTETQHPHQHDETGDGHDHKHAHGSETEKTVNGFINSDKISFSRFEVKTGANQLGYTEVTLLGKMHKGDIIVTNGAYYLQSHLQKSESGGEHSH